MVPRRIDSNISNESYYKWKFHMDTQQNRKTDEMEGWCACVFVCVRDMTTPYIRAARTLMIIIALVFTFLVHFELVDNMGTR